MHEQDTVFSFDGGLNYYVQQPTNLQGEVNEEASSSVESAAPSKESRSLYGPNIQIFGLSGLQHVYYEEDGTPYYDC